jgi:hypothetical protein
MLTRPIAAIRSAAAAFALAMSGLAIPAQAHVADGWPIVAAAFDNAADCGLTVSGNGQFYRISARGYAPGSRARLFLTNADIKPIERPVRIDGGGTFTDFYLPFLWHHTGGDVSVTVASPECSLSVAFPWVRAQPVAR